MFTQTEIEAIREWCRANPKTYGNSSWRERLSLAWYTGHYGSVSRDCSAALQGIRNRPDLPNNLVERIRLLAKVAL